MHIVHSGLCTLIPLQNYCVDSYLQKSVCNLIFMNMTVLLTWMSSADRSRKNYMERFQAGLGYKKTYKGVNIYWN